MKEFDELFVNKEEINKELLLEVLRGKIELTTDGDVLFLDENLPPDKKIVIYLLANKIFSLNGIKPDEAEGPTAISKYTGMPEGTVKTTVRKLDNQSILRRTKDGKYFVPNYGLRKLKTWLGESI